MTVVTLRPSSTTANTGAVTGGGGTAHGALSDDSDASYVEYDNLEASEVTLTDHTLPAGAVIKDIAARVRVAKAPGSPGQATSTIISSVIDSVHTRDLVLNWDTPTTVSFTPPYTGFTDTQIDGGSLYLTSWLGVDVRIYEAYLDVTHVAKPVTNANSPTGTLTTSNLPTIGWVNTLDGDGGGQTKYQVRVFTAAQYGAGGFDPATSAATVELAETLGANTSWQVSAPLADATYRAYVRVAQTVNGDLHWSDYDQTEFTIDVDLPGAPTFTATADNANGRITLAPVDSAGVATTDAFELQRSLDGGTTWEPVRVLLGYEDGIVPIQPSIAGFTDGIALSGTSLALNLPSPTGGVIAGDLLVAIVAVDGNGTHTWPAGWTEIKDEAGNGSAVRAGVAYKRATGGETGSITLTTSIAGQAAYQTWCFRGTHPTTAPEVSAGVSASTANSANPDSLNPANWGTENTLWIACAAFDANPTVSAAPTNYLGFRVTVSGGAPSVTLATAYRRTVAASEDPGAFTHTLEDSRSWTLGVRPAGAAIIVYDYEAPNGTTMNYRARSLHDYSGSWAASAWVADTEAWSSNDWWVKHPYLPALNRTWKVRSYMTQARAGRAGVFQPLGATLPVVVSDTRETARGVIVLRSDSILDQAELDALLDATGTLFIQGPANAQEPGYVRVLSHERSKPVDMQNALVMFESLEYVVVGSPPSGVVAWP